MSELQFDGQRPGEKLKIVFRRHILTARRGILLLIICVGLGVVPKILWPDVGATVGILVGAIILGLICLGYALLMWYFSVYIVTNERIRQITQKGMFKKTVTDLNFNKIQNISYHVGFVGGIFGFGTIIVQTGAGDFTISTVPHVEAVYNKIQNLAGKEF